MVSDSAAGTAAAAVRARWATPLLASLPAEQKVRERNAAITGRYASWYRGHTPLCKWAGAAAFASHQVGVALAPFPSASLFDKLTDAVLDDLHIDQLDGWALSHELDLIRETNNLVFHDKLRYRLMPYIYTVAARTYHNDYTIMRGLFMDFPADMKVRDIADQYMFGPAFLVSPVYEYGARTRDVYLPAGTSWYDFYTAEKLDGGAHVNAAAPLSRIPLYVRAGSIIPFGPEIQYTAEKSDAPITLYVYTGRDGTFALYEDAGVDYGYEKGEFSTIPLSYNDAKSELVIGTRTGEFPGMAEKRTFNVRWISADAPRGFDTDTQPDQPVEYSGAAVTVRKSAAAN